MNTNASAKHKFATVSHQAGVTIFEVILVLGIMSALLYATINQYYVYKQGKDILQLQSNVDDLFFAATKYYQANCSNQTNPTTGLKIPASGALDPSNSPTTPFVVTVAQLQNGGYLAIPPVTGAYGGLGAPPFPVSPFVDGTGANFGYQIQFNQATSPRNINTYPSSTAASIGNNIVWTIQISVQLLHTATALQYQQLLGADCVSVLNVSGAGVTPCVSGSAVPIGSPLFLVWQRLPSMSTSYPPVLWEMNPTVTQFNQMYTTDPITFLLETGTTQNYLCNS